MSNNYKDNIFSANHRSAMIARHGYTSAMTVTVDDLLMQATFEAEFGDHDCKYEGHCTHQQQSAEL